MRLVGLLESRAGSHRNHAMPCICGAAAVAGGSLGVLLHVYHPNPRLCCRYPCCCLQRDRWAAVLRGVFAGNIFDLGCAATTSMYHEVRHAAAGSWQAHSQCMLPV